MIDQRDLGRHESFEIVVSVSTATRSDTGPLRLAGQAVGICAPYLGAVIGIGRRTFRRIQRLGPAALVRPIGGVGLLLRFDFGTGGCICILAAALAQPVLLKVA